MPRGGLAAEGAGGAGVAGSPTDAGVISSPGSFGSCAIARRTSAAGISGGSGVARGVVGAEVASGGGACAITMPAAIMDMAVEIADVPSSRPKRRELDMMEPQMPELDQLARPADSSSRGCARSLSSLEPGNAALGCAMRRLRPVMSGLGRSACAEE
jgi:hypothetical protein